MSAQTNDVFSRYSLQKDPADGRHVFRDLVSYSVDRSKLTKGREEDFVFYADLFEQAVALGHAFDRMMICDQPPLADSDQLSALGLRKNAKLSIRYLATLNDRGLSDPVDAADSIFRIVNSVLGARRSVVSDLEVFPLDTVVEVIPSNMVAGPCDAVIAVRKRNITLGDSLLLPLADCTHPDQCGCLQSISSA